MSGVSVLFYLSSWLATHHLVCLISAICHAHASGPCYVVAVWTQCGFADDVNDAALFEKIKSGKYDDGDPVWDTISSGAKSLVAQMLDIHAESRISAEQCLQHHWLVQQSGVVEALADGAELQKPPHSRVRSERQIRTVSQMQFTRSMQKKALAPEHSNGEVPAIVEGLLSATKNSFTEGQGSAIVVSQLQDDGSNAGDRPDISNCHSDLGDDIASYL